MKKLIFLFILLFALPMSTFAQEGFTLGLEAGVAQLKAPSLTIRGTSAMFHAEYEVDPLVAFFGTFGFESAEQQDDSIDHRLFGGGISLALLPILDFRAGLAINIWEMEKDGHKDDKEALSPLIGVTVHQTTGSLKWGASSTATRSGEYQSIALRVFVMLLME